MAMASCLDSDARIQILKVSKGRDFALLKQGMQDSDYKVRKTALRLGLSDRRILDLALKDESGHVRKIAEKYLANGGYVAR